MTSGVAESRGATRSEAKAAGHRYYQGSPCRHGHTQRYVCNQACVECARAREAGKTKTGILRGIGFARDGNHLTITVPQGMSVTIRAEHINHQHQKEKKDINE